MRSISIVNIEHVPFSPVLFGSVGMYRLLVYVLLFIIPIVAAVENSQHAEVGQRSRMTGEVVSPHEKLVQDTIINDVEVSK